MDVTRYRLLIAYEGTCYAGWQLQPNAITIQELIERALHTVLRVPIRLIGSGRTDAGVHAIGQVAHMDLSLPIDPYQLRASLNGLLPIDIRILAIEAAPSGFHAQHSAQGKTYCYHLWLSQFVHPLHRRFVWHMPYKCDVELMQEGAKALKGRHDFRAFSNEAHKGAAARNSIRTVRRLDIEHKGPYVTMTFEGDGFLYKMVRNMVGTLVECGMGRRSIGTLSELLASRDRRKIGRAAPPQGLFLVQVEYVDGFVALPAC